MWWYENPTRKSQISMSRGGSVVMHRKYSGWSELQPTPRAPLLGTVLEAIVSIVLTAIILAGVVMAVFGLDMLLG